ncbi:411_t:CDS:10 [Paraglomus brasilianum]|uniref:mRNA export factor GLE1 n=1 Tax=Paraglomus brasilianum TaxID=144538 RepID=A0A9N8VIA4_9GLOM|nr:411_t:CDS:10 [Paraglomus brasilianum]
MSIRRKFSQTEQKPDVARIPAGKIKTTLGRQYVEKTNATLLNSSSMDTTSRATTTSSIFENLKISAPGSQPEAESECCIIYSESSFDVMLTNLHQKDLDKVEALEVDSLVSSFISTRENVSSRIQVMKGPLVSEACTCGHLHLDAGVLALKGRPPFRRLVHARFELLEISGLHPKYQHQILNFENGFPSLHANHSRQLDRNYTMVKPVRQQDLDFMKVEHGWWEAERIAQTHQRVQEAIKKAEQEFVEQEKQGWEEGQRLYVQLQRNRAEQIAELEYMRSHKFIKRQQMVDAYCQKFDQQLDKVLETFTSTFEAEERKITAAREAAEHARREEEARKAAAAAAEIRRKAEEEKRQAEETARKVAEAKQKALQLKMEQLQQQQQKLAEASVSENVLKKEKEYKDFIQKCKNDLKNDPRLNADRSTIKQHFTLRLNQLTNKKDHIMTTANELSAQLTGAGMSPEQHYYRLNMLAKTIVDQIGITVLDRPEMAFAFGHLCILLYSKYAEFKKFVDARLAKKCPYVLPRYYDKSPSSVRTIFNDVGMDRVDCIIIFIRGQSSDEYDKLVGRQSNETEEVYRKRVLAYVRFHLAILQTKPWIPNIPYQKLVEESWKWIAEILNLKSRSITPAILDVFIEVVAHRFYEAFQRDGLKILTTIYRRYYADDTEELKQLKKLVPGDVAVLQNRLQECFTKQTFAEPQGRTPL